MDARQLLEPNALQNLVSNFNDDTIGVVSGELIFREEAGSTTASQGVGFLLEVRKVHSKK